LLTMPENESPEEYRGKSPNGFGGEDEIDLLELWRVVWKRRKLIVRIVSAVVLMTIVVSLFMTNIYQAEAVIVPVETKNGGGGMASALMSQMGGGFGGLIGLPESSSSMEIGLLLESKVLRKKIINDYNLLPILFPEQWDQEKKVWKKGSGWSLNPLAFISKLIGAMKPADKKGVKKDPGIPDELDGLRMLENLVKINKNKKDNYITISVQFDDPDTAAAMVGYFLMALNDHMSKEAKRVATMNKKYLEEQLSQTNDPLIQQKIYNMIAQQMETSMMAAVKENFAFKIIDPPLVPDKKLKPKRAQMVVLSFVVALFLAVFVVFFLDYLEKNNIHIKYLRKK
jgi:uncharacterized protein involved in exopolysaccharide biosynthesis